jgi:serine phosphatase RsbU (regulator of sigma subunit)
MGWRARNRELQQTLRTMPVQSRMWLLLAVFLTFASLALSSDASAAASGFWIRVAAWAWLSGVIGVGYGVAGFGYRKLLPFVIALNVVGPVLLYRWTPPRAELQALSLEQVDLLQTRLQILASVRTVTTLLAYSSFIALLRVEGRRSIGAHTEIRLAREIHAGLVPIATGQSGSLEWYGASHPSGEVGGDLVDVVCDSGLPWTACVADVSGHGVAAGVLMGMFKTALRAAHRTGGDSAAVLTQVNAVLQPIKQANMFVTAALLSKDENDQLDYVLAGHPSLLYVERTSGQARWVGESQIAVGFAAGARYSAAPIAVAPGDLIVVVTDGLVEVFDRHDRDLGADGLRRIVEAAARRASLVEIADDIFAACARYGTQTDDQSLLLLRRTLA